MKLLVGQLVERIGGEWNTYQVLEACESFALLECVCFESKEDLGDLIFCERKGQQIWISQHHAVGFEETKTPSHYITTVKTNLKHA